MEWPLLITDEDLARLSLLAAPAELQREIGRATVISPKVAGLVGVVTMNSRVLYTDETTGARQLVNLVYPQDADDSGHRVSVVAPVGTALIGLSAGQAIEWDFPDGTRRRLRVDEVSHGDDAQTAAFTP
jgi:regulator of nucleoside diphosphate kinase